MHQLPHDRNLSTALHSTAAACPNATWTPPCIGGAPTAWHTHRRPTERTGWLPHPSTLPAALAPQVKYMRKQFGSNVTFVLMNSFSTSADTREALSKAHPELLTEPLIELLQNKSPKVDAATLAPATHPAAPDNEW